MSQGFTDPSAVKGTQEGSVKAAIAATLGNVVEESVADRELRALLKELLLEMRAIRIGMEAHVCKCCLLEAAAEQST